MTVTQATIEAIFDLRHRVLRAHLGRETARFEGDDDEQTIHLASRNESGEVIGCASIMRRTSEGAHWQLRGMAVDEAHRGQGVGTALLTAAHAATNDEPMWCNARLAAVSFYQQHGWRRVSDEFDVPTAGRHRRMLWSRAG